MKKKIIIKKFRTLLITIIVSIIVSFFSIYLISNALTPTLIDMAEVRLNKYSNMIFNNAVSQVLEDKITSMEIIDLEKNTESNSTMVDFNPIVINHIANLAATVVENNMTRLEKGDLESIGITNINLTDKELNNIKEGILAQVPAGRVTGISLLSNLGPKIPVRFHYTGNVNSNLVTKVREYGINNALIEIGLKLEISAQIILPFTTETKKLDCYIPIVIRMVQGEIPEFYGGSGIISRNEENIIE